MSVHEEAMGDYEETYKKPRCRVCGRRVRMLIDATAGKHGGSGGTCQGYRRPVQGAPPCTDACNRIGTVGVPYVPGKPHASTRVCDSPSHRAEASAWVERLTGQPGVFTPFRPARSRALTGDEALVAMVEAAANRYIPPTNPPEPGEPSPPPDERNPS